MLKMKKYENRLYELRKEMGFTQEEFGKKFYLAKTVISRYESGKRNIPNELLVEFAEFFDTSTDYILGRNVSKNPRETAKEQE